MADISKLNVHGVDYNVKDTEARTKKVNLPEDHPYGTPGQILRANGNGTTIWTDAATGDEVASAVTAWLQEKNTNGDEPIVVDAGLNTTGAAADSKATGDEITNLKDELIEHGAFNIVNFCQNKQSRKTNGITFTWIDECTCTVSGTSTANATSLIFNDSSSFPPGIKPGSRLRIKGDECTESIGIRIAYYAESSGSDTNLFTKNTVPSEFTSINIPANATGLYIRLQVTSGRTITDGVVKLVILADAYDATEVFKKINSDVFNLTSLYGSVPLVGGEDIFNLPCGMYHKDNDNAVIVDHSPTNVGFKLFIFYRNGTSVKTTLMFTAAGDVFTNTCNSSGVWLTDWKKLTVSMDEIEGELAPRITNIEEAIGNNTTGLNNALGLMKQPYNLLNFEYTSVALRGNPATINGITYEVLANGEILVTGVASANSTFYIKSSLTIPSGKYIALLKSNISSYANVNILNDGSVDKRFSVDDTRIIEFTEEATRTIVIAISNGTVLPEGGCLIQPMLVSADKYFGYIAPYGYESNYIPTILPELDELKSNTTDLSAKVDALNNNLFGYNVFNVVSACKNKVSETSNGITFTWDNDYTCRVQGTATDLASTAVFNSSSTFPVGVGPGTRLRCAVEESGQSGVGFKIAYYDSESGPNNILTQKTPSTDFIDAIVPENATGLYIGIQVWTDAEVSEGATLKLIILPSVYTSQELYALLRDTNGVPMGRGPLPYYYDDYMAQRIKAVNKLENEIAANSDSFMFITDYHVKRNAGNSLKMINKIVKETGITKLFFGGDAYQTVDNDNGNRTNEQAMAYARKYVPMVYSSLQDCAPEFFSVYGNHEWNHLQSNGNENLQNGFELNLAGAYNYCLKRHESYVSGMTSYGNYYVDNKAKKIRYFFLQEDGEARPTNDTLKWLGDQLLLVPAGYYVMVITHYAYRTGVADLKSYGNRMQYLPKLISDLLQAYNTRTTFSMDFSYTANGVTRVFNGSWNYASAPGNNVICIMCGHIHRDDVLEKSADNVLTIATTGDLCKNGSGVIMTFEDENGNTLSRDPGTIYEQAFDVCHIDLENRKVYLTRFGGGIDREYDW